MFVSGRVDFRNTSQWQILNSSMTDTQSRIAEGFVYIYIYIVNISFQVTVIQTQSCYYSRFWGSHMIPQLECQFDQISLMEIPNNWGSKYLHMKKKALDGSIGLSKHTPWQLFREDSMLLPKKNLPINHFTYQNDFDKKSKQSTTSWKITHMPIFHPTPPPSFSFSCSGFILFIPGPHRFHQLETSTNCRAPIPPVALGISTSFASPFSSFSAFSASNSVGPFTSSSRKDTCGSAFLLDVRS